MTRELRVGTDEPGSYASDIGAIATLDQLRTIEAHVADAVARGATVAAGGHRIDGPGLFHEPTVLLDVDHSMLCMAEETSGPTLPIVRVGGED